MLLQSLFMQMVYFANLDLKQMQFNTGVFAIFKDESYLYTDIYTYIYIFRMKLKCRTAGNNMC